MTTVSKGLLFSVMVILEAVEFLSDPRVIGAGLLFSGYYAEVHLLAYPSL